METIVKKFKKMTTVQLLEKADKLSGLELEACCEILSARGKDVSKWSDKVRVQEPEQEFIKTEVGSSIVYETAPEVLTKAEAKVLKVAESEQKVEDKAVEKAIKELKAEEAVIKKRGVDPLTEEQKAFLTSTTEEYQLKTITKKELVVKWIEFGIAKQQVDKFVTPTLVSWSYAYPIYKSYGK